MQWKNISMARIYTATGNIRQQQWQRQLCVHSQMNEIQVDEEKERKPTTDSNSTY